MCELTSGRVRVSSIVASGVVTSTATAMAHRAYRAGVGTARETIHSASPMLQPTSYDV